MPRPMLLPALALVALAPAASAQTGYGAPDAQEYRSEQRTTAILNDAVDDGYDAAIDERRDAGAARDDYYGSRDAAPDRRYARRVPNRSSRLRDLYADHAEACRSGDDTDCFQTGTQIAEADPRGRMAWRDSYDEPAERAHADACREDDEAACADTGDRLRVEERRLGYDWRGYDTAPTGYYPNRNQRRDGAGTY